MKISKKHFRYCLSAIVALVIMAASMRTTVKVGDNAPGFSLSGLNESKVTLSDYKGKLVVVHLWSHNCSHCRTNNQILPGIADPYKNSNLAYIMVDIDTDANEWKNIIKADKLDFAIHAIDGEAKTMSDYNAKATPCINIVNEKGNLLAMNVTDVQLKKILKKRFPKVVLRGS